MRPEAEESGARGTGSGGDSGDREDATVMEREVDQGQYEYSDAISMAVDEIIYHRLLDSLEVIRAERDRNLEA